MEDFGVDTTEIEFNIDDLDDILGSTISELDGGDVEFGGDVNIGDIDAMLEGTYDFAAADEPAAANAAAPAGADAAAPAAADAAAPAAANAAAPAAADVAAPAGADAAAAAVDDAPPAPPVVPEVVQPKSIGRTFVSSDKAPATSDKEVGTAESIMTKSVEIFSYFENQRYQPLLGFSAAHLLPTDRSLFSDMSGELTFHVEDGQQHRSSMDGLMNASNALASIGMWARSDQTSQQNHPVIPLPQDWTWVAPADSALLRKHSKGRADQKQETWVIDNNGDWNADGMCRNAVDKDGWGYAETFAGPYGPAHSGSYTHGVRRRRWLREAFTTGIGQLITPGAIPINPSRAIASTQPPHGCRSSSHSCAARLVEEEEERRMRTGVKLTPLLDAVKAVLAKVRAARQETDQLAHRLRQRAHADVRYAEACRGLAGDLASLTEQLCASLPAPARTTAATQPETATPAQKLEALVGGLGGGCRMAAAHLQANGDRVAKEFAEDDLKQLAVAFDRQAHEPTWLLHQLQERRKGAELRLWHAYNDAVRSAQAGAKTVAHKVGRREARSEDGSNSASTATENSASASGPEGWWLNEFRYRQALSALVLADKQYVRDAPPLLAQLLQLQRWRREVVSGVKTHYSEGVGSLWADLGRGGAGADKSDCSDAGQQGAFVRPLMIAAVIAKAERREMKIGEWQRTKPVLIVQRVEEESVAEAVQEAVFSIGDTDSDDSDSDAPGGDGNVSNEVNGQAKAEEAKSDSDIKPDALPQEIKDAADMAQAYVQREAREVENGFSKLMRREEMAASCVLMMEISGAKVKEQNVSRHTDLTTATEVDLDSVVDTENGSSSGSSSTTVAIQKQTRPVSCILTADRFLHGLGPGLSTAHRGAGGTWEWSWGQFGQPVLPSPSSSGEVALTAADIDAGIDAATELLFVINMDKAIAELKVDVEATNSGGLPRVSLHISDPSTVAQKTGAMGIRPDRSILSRKDAWFLQSELILSPAYQAGVSDVQMRAFTEALQGGAHVALHAAESRRQKLRMLKDRGAEVQEVTKHAVSRASGDAFGLEFEDAEL